MLLRGKFFLQSESDPPWNYLYIQTLAVYNRAHIFHAVLDLINYLKPDLSKQILKICTRPMSDFKVKNEDKYPIKNLSLLISRSLLNATTETHANTLESSVSNSSILIP